MTKKIVLVMIAFVFSLGASNFSFSFENNENNNEETKPYTAGGSTYTPIPMPGSVGADVATDLLETGPSDNSKIITVPASSTNGTTNSNTFSAPSALPETGV